MTSSINCSHSSGQALGARVFPPLPPEGAPPSSQPGRPCSSPGRGRREEAGRNPSRRGWCEETGQRVKSQPLWRRRRGEARLADLMRRFAQGAFAGECRRPGSDWHRPARRRSCDRVGRRGSVCAGGGGVGTWPWVHARPPLPHVQKSLSFLLTFYRLLARWHATKVYDLR